MAANPPVLVYSRLQARSLYIVDALRHEIFHAYKDAALLKLELVVRQPTFLTLHLASSAMTFEPIV
jgi:hypothetical protein